MSRPSPFMDDLSADWKEFLLLLISHKVEFMLVGGHAVAIHAQPRYTQDLDLFVEISASNAKKLRSCLIEFGFGSAAPDIDILATPNKIFMLGRKPYRIDILTSIDGVEFSEAKKSTVMVETTAGSVPVISREHLIRNKKAAGRPKDLADLAILEALQPPTPRKPSKKHKKGSPRNESIKKASPKKKR